MIKLGEPELLKLSSITNVTPLQLHNLMSLGLVNEEKALDALIRYDFQRVKRRKIYRVKQIVEAMMQKYNVPASRVQRVIYAKKKKRHYCEKCGKEIANRERIRGNGKCDQCVASEISI